MTKHNTSITLPRDYLEHCNDLLSGDFACEVKDAETITAFTAQFPDGCEAEIRLVSGGRTGEEQSTLPYVDAILFDPDGFFALLPADREIIDGTYEWSVDDDTYVLMVLPA